MKIIKSTLYTLFFIAVGIPFTSCEKEPEIQSKVFEGDVILSSQKQVEDFGAHQYVKINRNLYIGPFNNNGTLNDAETDISHLSALQTLVSVKGSVNISRNNNLLTLDGFNNLNSVGGTLAIHQNDGLLNIDQGLNELDSVGFGISIFENNGLEKIDGFNSLVYLDKFLSITQHRGLTHIEGFNNLNSQLESVTIFNNSKLVTINAFNSIEVIGYLRIDQNRLLPSF